METEQYAIQMERKLIKNFKEEFFKKLGYYPKVLSKTSEEKDAELFKTMSLQELEEQFYPFLPVLNGKLYHLDSKVRKREIVELRQMFCFMAKKLGYSLNAIGQHLGNKDHSTIIHNIKGFNDLYETNEGYRMRYRTIHNYIKTNYDPSVVECIDKE